MPRRNRPAADKGKKGRPIVSDLPGAAEARTDAFRPDLYLARLRLEAEEQKAERINMRRRNKKKRALEDDASVDADANANASAGANTNAGDGDGAGEGPPECIVSAARVLSCPSCAQRMDETESDPYHCHHDYNNDSGYGDDYGEDSQAMFDDSQHFMDTDEQIAREEESAARHLRRSRRYPHLKNLGRRTLLLAPTCGHVFCADCWEREKGGAAAAGGGGWHGSATCTSNATADDKDDANRKVPCPICLVPTPCASVGGLRINGEELVGPTMSAMGAVLLRGMMMMNNGGGRTTSRDDIRRAAGEIVPGTNWKKIGRKRRSDAYVYVDMTNNEATSHDISGNHLLARTKTKKIREGRPSALDGDASSTTGRGSKGASKLPSLLPIKEESQSQLLSSHRDAAGEDGDRSDQDDNGQQELEGSSSKELREQEDETMDRPASHHSDTDATADDVEDTQRLDLDLLRSITGDKLDDDDDDNLMEGAGDEDTEGAEVDAADAPATDTDATVPNGNGYVDTGGLAGNGGRPGRQKQRSADRESQATSGSDATVPPANAASAASSSAKATSSTGDRMTTTCAELLAPKGSRIIDPGPSKKRGRMKRRKAGAGLNLRKNKAKALEESLSFHGSQSQASVCGSQSTAGSPSEKKASPATGNEFSFRSESSMPTSQEGETPVPADGGIDARDSDIEEDGHLAKKQRVEEESKPTCIEATDTKTGTGVDAGATSPEDNAVSTSSNCVAADHRKSSAGSSPSEKVANAGADGNMTTPASKRKHKHTIFETIEEVDDEIIEFTGTDGKLQQRRIDRGHEIIPVNTLVRVANRTFPGSNKLGGVATIKKSSGSVEDHTLVYSVAFVLGGRDTNIPYIYVVRDDAFSDADDEPRATPGSRRRSTRACRSSTVKPQKPACSSSSRRRSPRTRQSRMDDAVAAPRYAEVEEHDDEDADEGNGEGNDRGNNGGQDYSDRRRTLADTTAAVRTDDHSDDDDEEESDEETRADALDLTSSQIGSQQSPALLPIEPEPSRELQRADASPPPAQPRLNMSAEGQQPDRDGEEEDDDDDEEDSQTQLPPRPEDSDETAKPQSNDGIDLEDDDSQTQAPPYLLADDHNDEPSESPALDGHALHVAGTTTAKRSGSTKTPIGTALRCVAETTRATDKTKRDAPASPIAGAARNLDSKFVAIGDDGIAGTDGGDEDQDENTNGDDRSVDSDATEEVPATEMQQYSQESEMSQLSPDLLKQTEGSQPKIGAMNMDLDEPCDSQSQVPATEPQLSPVLLDNRQSPGGCDGQERNDSCSEVPATEAQGYSQGSPDSLSQQSQVFDFSIATCGGDGKVPSSPSRTTQQEQQLPPRGNHYSPSQESLHSQDPCGREQSEPSEMYFLPSQAPSQLPTNPSSPLDERGQKNSPVSSPDRSQGSVDAAGAYSPASPEDSLDRHLDYLEHGTQTESQIEPSQRHPTRSTRFSSLKKAASGRRGLHVEFDMTAKQSTAKKPRSVMGNPDTPATGYSTTTDTSTILIDNNVGDDPLPETEEVPATEPPPGYYESEIQRDRTDLQLDESQFPETEEVPATLPPPDYYESQVQRDRTELLVGDESQFLGDGTEEIPATLPPPGYEESQVQRDRSELRVEEGSQFHEELEEARGGSNKKRKREERESEGTNQGEEEGEVPSSVPQSSRYSSSMPMADSEFASLARQTKEGLARRAGINRQEGPMKLRRVSEAVARDDADHSDDEDRDPQTDGGEGAEGNASSNKNEQGKDDSGDETGDEDDFECELRLPSQENLLVPGPSTRTSMTTATVVSASTIIATVVSTKVLRPLIICHPKAMTEDEQSAALRLQNELGMCDITFAYGNYNDMKVEPERSFFVVHTRSLPLLGGDDDSNKACVCDRSLEYLNALASGSSIVSADWLVTCNEKSRWLDPKPFVAWGDSRSYVRLKENPSPPDWLVPSFKGAGICSRSPTIRALIDRGTMSPLLSSFAVVIVPTTNKAQNNEDAAGFELKTEQLRQLALAHGGTVVETGEEQLWRKPLSSTKGIIVVPNSIERSHDAISSFLLPWLLTRPSIISDTATIQLYPRSGAIQEACSSQQSQTTSQDRGGFIKLPIIRARWLEDSAASLRRAPLKDYCIGVMSLDE